MYLGSYELCVVRPELSKKKRKKLSKKKRKKACYSWDKMSIKALKKNMDLQYDHYTEKWKLIPLELEPRFDLRF